jgi:hypothetical protein
MLWPGADRHRTEVRDKHYPECQEADDQQINGCCGGNGNEAVRFHHSLS